LHSLPSAPAKLYLDLDGDPPSTFFYQPVPTTPAFDVDGDPTTFSSTELADIQQIWQRLAEKFSPFKLDVTTVDPGNLNDHQTFRLVIGGNGAWAPAGEAGVSQPGGFAMSGSSDNTAYVFPSRLGNDVAAVGEVAAHEAGHGFGLVHSSVAGTTLRAPIMGTSLGSEQRRTWYNGPTPYGVNQDDLAVIADTTTAGNGFGYRVDDVGDTLAAASGMTISAASASAWGVISKTSDRDYFSFTTSSGGTVSINGSIAPYGAMLDLKLELRDAANNLLASADTSTLGESLSFGLPSAGTYYIVVASHGSYGDVGQYTLNVTLPSASTPAPVANVGGPYSVGEGSSLSLSASASTGSNLTYAWDLDGDGIYGESGAAATRGNESGVTSTFSAAGLDGPSSFSIAIRVTDDQNRTSTASDVININNLAPTLTIGGNPTVNEGSSYTLSLSVADPGADAISTWTINWGDGNVQTLSSSPSAATHTFADNGSYSISASATDEDGTYSANTKVVTVANVAPTIALVGNSTTTEGASYSLTLGAITDPGADTVTQWLIDWGDGINNSYGSAGAKTHVYADGSANRIIVVRVVDEDGTFVAANKPIVVNNVTPTLAIGGNNASNEGSSYTLNMSATDPGSDAITNWTINWGDGNIQIVSGNPSSAAHIFADNGNYTIGATATDEDGTYSTNTVTVAVANVEPTIALSGNSSVNEGSTYSLTLGGITDPGADTVTEWTINWGDGSSDSYSSGGTRAHTFADGLATRSIVVSLLDEDGTHNAGTKTITVSNVAPTLTLAGNPTANSGASYTLALGWADPGADTLTQWVIDWGDGMIQPVAGNATTVTHTFDSAGDFAVSATASDEDGTYSAAPIVAVHVTTPLPDAPIADAGGPYAVDEGGMVQLSGSNSTGTSLSYAWDLDGDGIFGESGAAATRGDESGPTPTFNASGLDNGSRAVSLRVTDSANQTSDASATITINNVAPQIDLTAPATHAVGTPYGIAFSASDPGADTISNWRIDWGDGTITDLGGSTAGASHNFAAGNYAITLTATDEDGSYTVSSDITISNQPDTTAPIASIGTLGSVTVAGDGTYAFDASYSDNAAINWSSLGNSNLLVTGPNGFSQLATLIATNSDSDASLIVATYRITVPSGAWTSDYNGTYTITLQANQVTDTSGNPAASNVLGTFNVSVPPPPDYSGNDRFTARNIGTFTPGRTSVYRDSVGPSDVQDYYRFKLTYKSVVTIKLYELTADASIQLRTLDHKLLKSSARAGTRYELISVMLDPGSYYIRVLAADVYTTGYAVRIAVTAPPTSTATTLQSAAPTFDAAGNDRSSALDIGDMTLGRSVTLHDRVGPEDVQDYCKFRVTTRSAINIELSNLSADAALQLRSLSNTLIASSSRAGTQNEMLTLTLDPGTYYVRVLSADTVSTLYSLRLVASSPG
jgi:hypothetical protein